MLLSHAGFERFVPGGLGVTIFFFLSGYLITTLLIREHARFGSIDIYAFCVRRFFRLMPPLLVTLDIAYVLTFADIPGQHHPRRLCFAAPIFRQLSRDFLPGGRAHPTGTGVLWSLAVEEHFYLVFPVLMSIAFATGIGDRAKILFGAAICILVLGWRSYLVYGIGSPDLFRVGHTDRLDRVRMHPCLLSLAAKDAPSGRWTHDSRRAALLLLLTLVNRDPQFRETLRYSMQGIALMPIFYLAIMKPQS
ncbi:acyltransferase [Mesorhizobium sp. AR10]|uniref:acyltransferase family protein n=1 Tax=Mesorhizobium sp. AR10 TaxID=2865839 RepID=UPI0021600D90|nr:acyltransferase [Mesorhizobium sp. AR10]UVK40225.1 acyltransferase [Mesorhizobium sp. AR10]